MNGGDVQPFDFELPGVHSMSADLHKYGYAAKGASTVFFRSKALRDRLTFDERDWPGGRMVTPTLAGTRPGGAIAAAWAVMNHLGVAGYRAKQRLVAQARAAIEDGVKAMGFTVLGRPQLGLIAFTHDEIDCAAVWTKLRERGWFIGMVTEPRGLQLMLSPIHAEISGQFLADLAWAVETVKGGEKVEAAPSRYS
jgi:glutamate/tyrosine decarboxylase-like PLP-dependent enzyme